MAGFLHVVLGKHQSSYFKKRDVDHDLLPRHYESNDHDDFANTGYAIAEFLNERPELQRASTIIVHTRNADAAIPMVMKLRESGRNVEYCAFPMLDLKIRNYWKR